MSKKSENSDIRPYKEDEYRAFVKTLESGAVSYWSKIAEALGVDKDTITSWKKLPEAREAIQKGIEKCLNNMETSGKRDWRMWQERLKILNIVATEKHDVTSGGEKITPIFGGLSEVQNNDSDQEDIQPKKKD